MILCPYCGSENIEGADDCAGCLQPLHDTHLAPPRTSLERAVLHDRVAALKPKQPITVAPDMPVGQVLRLMVEHRIGCVLVTDGARLLGIFSERDALRRLGASAATHENQPVSEFMTAQPQTLVADAKVAFAVHRMDLGGYRHLPVVDQRGQLQGIISARDILRHLTESLAR
jgi:CBS domain-containing protein